MKQKNMIRAGFVLAVALLLPRIAAAQSTFYWTNTQNDTWGDTSAWTNGNPQSTDTGNILTFAVGNATYTATNNFTSYTLNGLIFGNGDTVTLAGNTLVFTNTASALPVVTNGSGHTATINNNITLATNTLFGGSSASSGIILNGLLSGTGGFLVGASAPVTLAGSGSSTWGGFTVSGQGTLLLNSGTYTSSSAYTDYIGVNSGDVAAFGQNGGTLSGSKLYVGYGVGAAGTCNLTNGIVYLSGTNYIGYSGTGTFNMVGGTLTNNGLYIGVQNNSVGVLNQSGGAITNSSAAGIGRFDLGYTAGAQGTYNLSGGSFYQATNYIAVGLSGNGTINQTNGTLVTGANAQWYIGDNAGSTGTYNLVGGSASMANYVEVGANSAGTLNMTGGTLTNTGSSFDIGDHAGSFGVVNQTNGAVFINHSSTLYVANDAGATGTYNLVGGNLTVAPAAYVGYNGNGTFNQSGGWYTGSNTLTIGTSNGTVAVFNQSGGTLTNLNNLYIGYGSGATGTYNLSGSGALYMTNAAVYIGYNGVGVINQTNGTIFTDKNNQWYLGDNAGATGTYNLVGGAVTMSTYCEVGATGAGILNIYGGALTNTGSSFTFGFHTGSSGVGNQTNGTVFLNNSTGFILGYENNATGTYNLAGGSIMEINGPLFVGMDGAGSVGTFNMTGGTLTMSNGNENIAMSNGTYGVFNQSGGTNILGPGVNLILGYLPGSYGTYNMTNGDIFISAVNTYIARSGTGVFNMVGGLLTNNNSIYIGAYTNSIGIFNQSGGTVLLGKSGAVEIGGYATGNSSYGFYKMSGGTNQAADNFEVGKYGGGLLYQSGGLISVSGNPLDVNVGSGTGVVFQTGGLLLAQNIYIGGSSSTSGSGVYNQNGGLAMATNGVQFTRGSGGTDILNLNGGTLAAPSLINAGTGGVSIVNFNGGTLLSLNPTATNLAGMVGLLGYNVGGGTTGAVSAAYVWSGGAIIDTSNTYINIMQNLLAPPGGNGVSNITVSGASGYLGAPLVLITGGGGSNATAVAQLDGSGNVTNILITCAGSGYTGNPTITLAGGGGAIGTLSASIGANNTSGSLTKLGTGLLVLGGANTYSGGTLINSGTLAVSNDAALGASGGGLTLTNGSSFEASGTFTLNNRPVALQTGGGNVNVDSSYTLTVTNPITGTGGLTVNGAGTLVLGGTNSFSGGTVVNNGLLQQSVSGALPIGGAVTINGGAVDLAGYGATIGTLSGTGGSITNGGGLTVTQGITGTYSGVIAGGGALTKAGGSTLTLAGANSYSGGTIINNGTLAVSNDLALGAAGGGLTLTNAGIFEASGTITLNGRAITLQAGGGDLMVDSGYTLSQTNAIVGTGGLTLSGAGTLILGGTNTYSGGTVVQSGTLQLGAASAFPGYALTISGGRFDQNGNAITVTTLNGSGGTLTNAGLAITSGGSFAGAIVGGGALTNTSGALTLSGANSYSSGTLISGGTLNINNANALGAGTFTIAGGTMLDNTSGAPLTNASNNAMAWNGPFTYNGTTNLNLGTGHVTLSNSLTVTNTANTLTVGGVIGDGGSGYSLTKAGAGTMVLSGANTYSGGTVINAGTLALSGSGSVGTGNIGIHSGGTFDLTDVSGGYNLGSSSAQVLTNNGTVNGGLVIGSGALVTGGGNFIGTVTNNSGGTLTPGTGGATNFFQNLTLAGGSTNSFWIGSATTHDMSIISNSLTITGSGMPQLKLDLTDYKWNVGDQIVLYDNLFSGTSGLNGSSTYFQTMDAFGNVTNLFNNTVFSEITGSGGSSATNLFNISYDAIANGDSQANDIMVTTIPEPGSLNLVIMLGAAYVMRRRILRPKGRWKV